jgi:hypothetical protein
LALAKGKMITNTHIDYKLALIGAIHRVVRKAGIWITNKNQAIRFKKTLMNLNFLMVLKKYGLNSIK